MDDYSHFIKPVHILSGFLGSGKTTFLNKILQTPQFSDTLVIINEFGEVALDHLLVEKSSDTILELSNGCLCCSIRGELIDTLLDTAKLPCKRVIIETTGIADPLPVLQSIAGHQELANSYRLAGSIVLFDLLQGKETIEKYVEAQKQLALADTIILSKEDLLESSKREFALETAGRILANFAPMATVLKTEDLALLKPENIRHNPTLLTSVTHQAHDHYHKQAYQSLVLRAPEGVDAHTLHGFFDYLLSRYSDNILRIKGLVKIKDHPENPLVIQISGPTMSKPYTLNEWPEGQSETALVVITSQMDPTLISKIFNGFMGNPEIDTPDQSGLSNNPLAIPGYMS